MPSGDSLILLNQDDQALPAGAGVAALETRNRHRVLAFDDTTIEEAIFEGVLPRHYANGGITVLIIWAPQTSVTVAHRTRWGGSFERMEDNGLDIDADSFATEKTVDANPRATSGLLTYTQLAFAQNEIDGVLPGESFRFKLRRVANHANDDMVGDAEVLRVELRET